MSKTRSDTQSGSITRWNDARGFGFIAPDEGGPALFVHVSGLQRGTSRPAAGDRVHYAVERDEAGRLRATRVLVHAGDRTERARTGRRQPQRWSVIEMLAVGGVSATLIAGVVLYGVTIAVPIVVALMSVATALALADDKRRAEDGRWRTSESSLLLLCLLGGWAGAIAAMRWYRHKTTKPGFVGALWVTVLVNLVAIVLVVFPLARDAVIAALEVFANES